MLVIFCEALKKIKSNLDVKMRRPEDWEGKGKLRGTEIDRFTHPNSIHESEGLTGACGGPRLWCVKNKNEKSSNAPVEKGSVG